VSKSKFDENWNKIFVKKEKEFELTKDWYLHAINPWYKFYFNAKTGEHKMIPLKRLT